MKLKALKNNVVVEKINVEKISDAGLIVPASEKDVIYGKIVSVGKNIEDLHKRRCYIFPCIYIFSPLTKF